MKVLQLIVRTSINIAIGMLWLYGFARFTFWVAPEDRWLNLACCSLLAVDYALIVSGIKPGGFASWWKKE